MHKLGDGARKVCGITGGPVPESAVAKIAAVTREIGGEHGDAKVHILQQLRRERITGHAVETRWDNPCGTPSETSGKGPLRNRRLEADLVGEPQLLGETP